MSQGELVRTAEVQIPLFALGDAWERRRREERDPLVRRVEYCRFPRVCADQRLQSGVTRDVSPSGLCLRAERPEPLGSLLRVIQRSIDGRTEREAIGRVAWVGSTGSGDHWLGLALVAGAGRRPLSVGTGRRLSAAGKVA